MSSTIKLRFRPDVSVNQHDNGLCTLTAANAAPLNMHLKPGTQQAFAKLANGGASEAALAGLAQSDGMAGMLMFYRHLHVLNSNALLTQTLSAEDRPLLTLIPTDFHYRFNAKRLVPSRQYQLSPFALLRQDDSKLIVESPLGLAKVELLAPEARCLVGLLVEPQTVESLLAIYPDLGAANVSNIVNLLLNAEVLTHTEAEASESLMMWDFHDLLFHTRSRLGRHNNPYGGTYRFKETVKPLPLVKQVESETVIKLPKPDIAALRADDTSFTDVLERRRSWRYMDEDRPITLAQLGEFLYRTARLTHEVPVPKGESELGFRLYPSGGAMHELDIYPVIDKCDGLASGIYWYNPREHTLSLIVERNEYVERMLFMAWNTADRRSQPQVYFAITARFQRMQWKYESMVYATILKHVGALYQTMYLVATAMGLAACGLGGGDSDMFARAAGLDYYAESPVGDFILGSRGVAPADAPYPN